MIITEFYNGQGLGNQIWCYVTTRVIASKKGYDFGIKSPEKFKGFDFMDLDFGKQVFGGNGPEGGPPQELPKEIKHYYVEQKITHPDGSDIRTTDNNLINILDNTKIDGYMQDVRYISDKRDEIKKWLKINEEFETYEFSKDDICVINFRGGGYTKDKSFFLPKEYWENAISHMLKINKNFKFVVITDDVIVAKKFFPEYAVYHFSIAKDYVVIKNAKYLILSNSSFAWFPAWLSDELKYCIAPKYWGRHNTSDGYWSLGYNITPGWMYQDRDGKLFDYETCIKELDEYTEKNKKNFIITKEFDHQADYVAKEIEKKEKKFSSIKRLYSMVNYKARVVVKKIISSSLSSLSPERFSEREAKKSWLTPNEIAEYRKKIKIYDVFTFFNELDLLEIRLNILDKYVDYFVIVEATETFSGHPKPLYYDLNKERFKKWHGKIIHYIIDDTPKDEDDLRSRLHQSNKQLSILDKQIIKDSLTSDNIGKDAIHWFKEFYQKEVIKKALINLNDNDVCYISDLDEIWNPELLIDYSKDSIFKPIQTGYQYYLNNRSNEDWHGWTGTIATKYENIKYSCLNHLRTHKKMRLKYIFLKNGGWHFAFQGGYEGVLKKIKGYKHDWYNPILNGLENRISKNQDHRGKKIKLWVDESNLPKFLLENKDKYIKLFK